MSTVTMGSRYVFKQAKYCDQSNPSSFGILCGALDAVAHIFVLLKPDVIT